MTDDDADTGRRPRSQEWALATGARRSSLLVYRSIRALVRTVLFWWFRVQVQGAENLAFEGPAVVAPVHRSNLDVVFLSGVTHRRLRALGKESLFVNPVSAWVCAALGAIPIERGAADRHAMRAARDLIASGEMMIVFPEGTRQTGERVAGVFDGVSYLAAKAPAPIVPIGIAGTEGITRGRWWVPRRTSVSVVVGDPIAPPEGRVSRPALSAFSERVASDLQDRFDDAIELAAS